LIFPEHPGILYAGRKWKTKELSSTFLENQFTHPLQFDAVALRERFYKALEKYVSEESIDLSEKKAIVVSHESLHSGPDWFGADFVMMAKSLKEVFPAAKIIIGIRNQPDYIESNYKEYIVHGGKLRFSHFIHQSFAFHYGLKSKLMFDQAIALYAELFGKENLHVYLLEDLKLRFKEELDRMLAFTGAGVMTSYKKQMVNVSLGRNATALLRMINVLLAKDFNEQYYNWQHQRLLRKEKMRWFFVRLLRKLSFGGKGKSLFTTEARRHTEQLFSASNERLAAMLQRDLKKEGYR
jgi:hypothetical protein